MAGSGNWLQTIPTRTISSQHRPDGPTLTHISVIICTHNPRPDYLRRVLEGLKAQTLPRDEWELLFIDNASNERLASAWDLSWHPRHTHVREDELGLTPARLRAIKETTGELLVFIDDDNQLAPDYLERAAAIGQMSPHLGVFGSGTLEPEFEIEPAAELVPMLGRLALRSVSSRLWTNNPKDSRCVPWGAGLCVTRSVATAYVQMTERLKITHLLDRHGERLYCGGDDLFSWVSARIGCGFGVFPELRITHLIGAHRLNQKYFLSLVHDHAYSHGILNYLCFGDEQASLGFEAVVRMLVHGMRRGWFSMRCQWAAIRGARGANRFLSGHNIVPISRQSKEVVVLTALLILESVVEIFAMMGNA
jgi:Glycosyl transferase family 2